MFDAENFKRNFYVTLVTIQNLMTRNFHGLPAPYETCCTKFCCSKINPADCVDMECDAKKKVIIKDEDGSFLGSVGAVIPQVKHMRFANNTFLSQTTHFSILFKINS